MHQQNFLTKFKRIIHSRWFGMESSMYFTFYYRVKRLALLFFVLATSILLAQTRYYDETHDFGLRTGVGFISGIDHVVHPLFDISSDYYFLSSDLRMTFGVSFIYPNQESDSFTVAGLQYLGVEYNIPFLRNVAQVGFKMTKTYLKDATDIDGSRGLSLYLGYKHPLSLQTDYYVQLGMLRNLVKEVTGDVPVDPHSLFFQTGVEYYF